MADDQDCVVRSHLGGIRVKLEGMPGLYLQRIWGHPAEPVLAHQSSVPGGTNAHQVQPAFSLDGGCHFGHSVGMLGQHFRHGLGLTLDGIVHMIGVLGASGCVPSFLAGVGLLLSHGMNLSTVWDS